MMRVVNLWKEPNWYVWEDQSPRWRDQHEAVGVKQGVDSGDEARHSKKPYSIAQTFYNLIHAVSTRI